MRLNFDEKYETRSSVKSKDSEKDNSHSEQPNVRPRASCVTVCSCIMVAFVLIFIMLIIAFIVLLLYTFCTSTCSCGPLVKNIIGCKDKADVISKVTSATKPNMYDCILNKVDGCPNMVGPNALSFSQYDFRIDQRSETQWKEAHPNEDWTLSMPGLADKIPEDPDQLFDWYPQLRKINKDSRILLWADNPSEAFSASLCLVMVGFNNVDCWFYGGFAYLNQTISAKNSAQDASNQPTRDACWMGWGMFDMPYCPKSVPLTNITSYASLLSLVGVSSINLADARSKVDWKNGTLTAAWNIANYASSNSSFERSGFVTKKNQTWVVFYKDEERYQWTEAFNAARNMMKFGFSDVWFVDKGGYDDLKDISGFATGIGSSSN